MHGHCWLRDKDGSHTIRSVVVASLMLHANLTALSLIEPELWAIKVLHCRKNFFDVFCFCDLDLDLMTFTYELDPYCREIHAMCKYEHPMSRLLKLIIGQTYRQTSCVVTSGHVTNMVVKPLDPS